MMTLYGEMAEGEQAGRRNGIRARSRQFIADFVDVSW
jgi:hypothetical protein